MYSTLLICYVVDKCCQVILIAGKFCQVNSLIATASTGKYTCFTFQYVTVNTRMCKYCKGYTVCINVSLSHRLLINEHIYFYRQPIHVTHTKTYKSLFWSAIFYKLRTAWDLRFSGQSFFLFPERFYYFTFIFIQSTDIMIFDLI